MGSRYRVAVSETRGHFWPLVEGDRQPLEAVTRGLIKSLMEDTNLCVFCL
jgi:hypothetical protein